MVLVLFSDIVTTSIGNETLAKTSGIENFFDKNYLNNLKKELLFEIKQHLSSSASSKTSENNYITKYIASLKKQIESVKGEILFLREELRKNNLQTKSKYTTSTANDTELRKINKDNDNKNDINSNKNIIDCLNNNHIFNDTNHTSISNINSNSNSFFFTNNKY